MSQTQTLPGTTTQIGVYSQLTALCSLRKHWFMCEREAEQCVITGGYRGHDQLVCTHWMLDVVSSACGVQEKYDRLCLVVWKWSCRRAKWLTTELTDTFVALIKWYIERTCSPCWFFTAHHPLPNRWNPNAASESVSRAMLGWFSYIL